MNIIFKSSSVFYKILYCFSHFIDLIVPYIIRIVPYINTLRGIKSNWNTLPLAVVAKCKKGKEGKYLFSFNILITMMVNVCTN